MKKHNRIKKKVTTLTKFQKAAAIAVSAKRAGRRLLTGQVVPELDKEVAIILKTRCPAKWVLVDLETGNQYSSTGSPAEISTEAYLGQKFVKPAVRLRPVSDAPLFPPSGKALPTKVEIIESERGWGQRVEGNHQFPTRAEAEAFVKKYNSRNKEATAPEVYWYARIVE